MTLQFCGPTKAVFLAVMLSLLPGALAAQEAAPGNSGYKIHIFPANHGGPKAMVAAAADNGPLVYHGGETMQWGAKTYAIFWIPAHLQNGGATSMSSHYQTVLKNLLLDYGKHGIDNNNTQYYQNSGTSKIYIQNYGYLAGSYIDTAPYPASGCSDSLTPGNCITDAQIQTEITRVMGVNGWTPSINNVFFLFTSSGEGSCFDSSNAQCSYTYYCAYHGYYELDGKSAIYANMPYGNTSTCQEPGTPSPNADPAADTTATAASHELTESITDPMLNAWYTAQGNEIGDLCAYNYGTNTWDSGMANQMWNGRFYELQTEFNNHTGTCVQVGP